MVQLGCHLKHRVLGRQPLERDVLLAHDPLKRVATLFHRVLWPRLARWGARRSSGFYVGLGALAGLGALVAIPFAPNHRPETARPGDTT